MLLGHSSERRYKRQAHLHFPAFSLDANSPAVTPQGNQMQAKITSGVTSLCSCVLDYTVHTHKPLQKQVLSVTVCIPWSGLCLVA